MMSVLLPVLIIAAQISGPPQQPVSSTGAPRPVEIVLYTDFQCPFCAQFAPVFRELQNKGVEGAGVTVQFKHFPLSIHPAAPLAHQAALAAGEQGKFWEMHDLLFANQAAVTREDLTGYAAKLGLDLDRFRKDLDNPRLRQIVASDLAEGQRLGVQGTPTFFINGTGYSGAMPLEQVKRIILNEKQRIEVMAEVPDDRLSTGPADAAVTLEFFADLQSPVTRPALEVLDQVIARYQSKVRIQFRNFPLSFHPLAPLAHEAAMAAAAKGRFWELARYILEHPDSLREQDLIAQAGRLGLDEKVFARVIDEHRYAPRVNADVAAGVRWGIKGSPVIRINRNRIDGVPSLEKIIEYVEAELAATAKNDAGRQ